MQNVRACTLLVCMISMVLSVFTPAQTSGTTPGDDDAVADQVERIFSSTLKGWRTVLNDGTVAITPTPPSSADSATIKKLGNKAIPALLSHLGTGQPREAELVLRFLDTVHSDEALEHLKAVLLTSPNSSLKHTALLYVERYPWERINDCILRAANDDDPAVRERARTILSRHRRSSASHHSYSHNSRSPGAEY